MKTGMPSPFLAKKCPYGRKAERKTVSDFVLTERLPLTTRLLLAEWLKMANKPYYKGKIRGFRASSGLSFICDVCL